MIILPINAILQGQSYTRPQVDAALALKQNVLTFDDAPTANSNNPVKSGGIKTELDGKLPIAENQEQAPVGYVLTKTSTGSQWQRASSEGGTIAAAANSYPVTLLASNWSDYTYVIATPTGATITADCDGILGLAPNASAAQVEAFQLAKIVVASQDANGITVVARGQVPTINLSLELTLFMKADYYTKTEEDALLATKAPLGSPALTGTPTAPTAASGTSTTQLATTAFVQNHSNLYGVCSTAAATAAKEVTIDYSGTLTLFTGLTVRVKFSYANSAENPTLNVNGTGAAPITQYGATTIPKNTTWPAGSVVIFVYDGANWIMQSLPQMAGLILDGIGIPNTDDLNNYVNTGWYYYNTAPTNAPVTTSYCGLHVERCGPNIRQTVYRGSYGNPDAPAEWVRYKYSTSAWTPWVQQVTQILANDITLHVNSVSGDDSNDGLTAANPKRTIGGAMNAIPHAVAGRSVTIRLAEGAYQTGSVLTISGWNGLNLTIGKEPSATTANIQIGSLKMEGNANCTFYFEDFKLTGYIQNFSDNKSGSFWANRLLCDGGVIDTRGGWSLISACTFRNISGNAISVTEGYCSITGTAIENTCSYGVKANVNGIVSFSLYNNGTYPPKNEATTPWYIVYSGRIFVGGKTYREVPIKDVLFSGDTYLNENAYTDISLTASYRNYPVIEILVNRGTTETRMSTLVNWQDFSLNAYFPICGPGPFYGAIRPQTYAGSETIIRFNGWVGNLATSIHVIGIYGINY